LPGNEELTPYLNLWALADSVEVKGNGFKYAGQHDVDIHGIFVTPTAFSHFTRTYGHNNAFGFGLHYKTTFGKDFREEQIQLRISPEKKNAPLFFVMVPVRQGETPPKFEPQKNGSVKVTFKGKTDTITVTEKGADLKLETAKGKKSLKF
jgi:hypothetical protein